MKQKNKNKNIFSLNKQNTFKEKIKKTTKKTIS